MAIYASRGVFQNPCSRMGTKLKPELPPPPGFFLKVDYKAVWDKNIVCFIPVEQGETINLLEGIHAISIVVWSIFVYCDASATQIKVSFDPNCSQQG